MNDRERDRLGELSVEVQNNSKQLEKITTNDLPHMAKALNYIKGILAVLVPLVLAVLALIGGLYFLVINLLR